jgi:uncharacterized protein YjbI with pentapeptide repeats
MLQKADFSKACLGNTEFTLSQLKDTCLYHAK